MSFKPTRETNVRGGGGVVCVDILRIKMYISCNNKITAKFSWWARVWIFFLWGRVTCLTEQKELYVLCTILHKKSRHGSFCKCICGKFDSPPVHGVISRFFSFHHPELSMQPPLNFKTLEWATRVHAATQNQPRQISEESADGPCVDWNVGYLVEGSSGFSFWRVKLTCWN